jgi:hypothetical protein
MSWSTRIIGALAASAVLLGTTAAAAQSGQPEQGASATESERVRDWDGHGIGLAIRSGSQYENDPAFDALDKGSAFPAGAAVEVDYRLDYLGLNGMTVFASGRWTGQSSDRFEGRTSFNWTRGLYMLGVQYGPWEIGTFRPVARIAGGYSTQRLQVDTTQPVMSDRVHDAVGMGSLGFELLTPRSLITGAPIRLGLVGQVGYIAQTQAEFDELSGAEDDWAREPLDIGTLPTSGPFWDVGVNLIYEW